MGADAATATKWLLATVVVVVAAGYAERFWPHGSIYMLALVLLSVAIYQGTLGKELQAIAKLMTG